MRVTIVGAGIAGLSTAWSLTKLGHDITLIEQSSIPNPLAASGDRHRMMRRAYGDADGYARTIAEAFDSWDLLWNDLGVSHYANCGVLGISQRAGDGAELFRTGLERMKFDYERLDPLDAAERYPFLDPATFRYAYLDHDGGALFSERIAHDMKAWLKMRGAEIRTHAKVLTVDAHAASVRTEDDTVIRADRLVVTAGAWTLQLLPALAENLMTYRNAVAYMEPPADLEDAWSNAPAIVDIGGDSGAYVLPPIDGIGLKFGAGVHKSPAPDPDANRVASPGEGDRLRRLFSPPFSRIDEYTVTEIKTCAYTFTADNRFFSKRIGNSLVVSACSGHGYKFGAAVGRRIAQALDTDDDVTLAHWLRAETV
ncbi:Monomeric sarcosine oxidase [Paraburkholderia domus]|uniref:Monomeric sarcosine oxidase n=1 Tax=Paraburkholderia domus TaxID=2793075 RepID=A0A9N8N744_9BURK|nr:FAD-dependent oxidoreductase [Paraburkholderia domus]MBK5065313.1 FAD-dependent oxidoreductase [Burkholderia sp. R-70199]MBK5089781.1 FAD-dependent oxidoreductase [Burkholderia sp. R-69927]MBK5124479.1 FAD-dependent oxidoreductase [Burkholderia sp. R-69980]MBK5168763.1 FAD-dependent oxidoreductase [Burkholderia sp. R-70211]MBK5184073.1 FAD-dependent oxidoreductase [Burkholderia sp. R-69749]